MLYLTRYIRTHKLESDNYNVISVNGIEITRILIHSPKVLDLFHKNLRYVYNYFNHYKHKQYLKYYGRTPESGIYDRSTGIYKMFDTSLVFGNIEIDFYNPFSYVRTRDRCITIYNDNYFAIKKQVMLRKLNQKIISAIKKKEVKPSIFGSVYYKKICDSTDNLSFNNCLELSYWAIQYYNKKRGLAEFCVKAKRYIYPYPKWENLLTHFRDE